MSTREANEIRRTARDIEALRWRPFTGRPGVWTKTLWVDPVGSSHAGLMRIEPGAGVPRHSHRHALHHIWVVEDSCEIGGRSFETGSYAFVPVGCDHEITRSGERGCTLFYLYLVTAEID